VVSIFKFHRGYLSDYSLTKIRLHFVRVGLDDLESARQKAQCN
jgi:hypothetical protein